MEMVRWERYLPRRVVRVLVVEPDDSTRNVISALLRNCNYKVTSVSDGLEAWQVLKEKPQSIDLVLTEVDLPLVSGFTLLTLLMDHHLCQRIPVIMMSSEDSISTVMKCILKGAADFLIKPIRKNELKNIWQHFWRRQISTAENKHPSTREQCPKFGGTSENTAARSHSSAHNSSEEEGVECQETKIIAKMEAKYRMDQRKTNSNSNEECVIESECGRETLCNGAKNLDALKVFDDGVIVKRAKLNDSEGSKFQEEERFGGAHREPVSLAVIDLLDSLGAVKGESETSNSIIAKSNSVCGLQLELSLQGSILSGSRTKEADGGCVLNHSNASAFSRYNSRNGFGCSLPSYSMISSKEQRTLNECKEAHESGIHLQSTLSNSGDDSTAFIDGKSEQVENTSAPWDVTLGTSKLDRTNSSRMCKEVNENTAAAKLVDNVGGFSSATPPGSKKDIIVSGGPKQVDTFHLSVREVALIKFRQKKKKRCFEKKIRYHSRKQLAEQRPRVKGQFVRQTQADSASSAS